MVPSGALWYDRFWLELYEARDQTDRQIFMSDTKYRTLRELKAVRYLSLIHI